MRRGFVVAVVPLAVAGCPGKPEIPASAGGKGTARDDRALGLVSAAATLGNVDHTYVLDPTSRYAPGRGIEKTSSGTFRATATACAVPRERAPGANVDATTIDFGFVGIAVDDVLVGADADLTAYFAAGASHERRRVSIAAVAFVRDLDPQFFDAGDGVTPAPGGCACGAATHFVGAVKLGAMLSYDLELSADEAHGRALDLFKAHLRASDGRITQRSVGGLEIDGLDAALAGSRARPVKLRVTNPVPIAYALHPIADVCKFAFPEPEVTPAPLDFGDVPYGREAVRLLHVVNRAPIDVQASYRGSIFEIPARASLDLEARWTPQGDAQSCEVVTRDESIVFSPRDASADVTPKQHAVRVVERVRTGMPTVTRRVRADTGESMRPDYAKSAREIACPPEYVVAGCRIESSQCGGGDCNANGYALVATESGGVCKFACSGPSSMLPLKSYSCRYEAAAECRLRCP